MTGPMPEFAAPAFAVFANERSKKPIFLASGLELDLAYRNAQAFAAGYNGEHGTGTAVIRQAMCTMVFGDICLDEPEELENCNCNQPNC